MYNTKNGTLSEEEDFYSFNYFNYFLCILLYGLFGLKVFLYIIEIPHVKC